MSSFDKAIEDLKCQKTPQYRRTAKKYGVPHETLRRRFQGIALSTADYHKTTQLLSHIQERVLVNQINTLSDRGLPPTNVIVKSLAFKICGKRPGKNWAYRFVQRHSKEIASVWFEGFDLACKKADNYVSVKQYFDLVWRLFS
jgi:hypothetical protein